MKKIVTVAMPGCGNCGDDLISELLQEHIHILYPVSKNTILGLNKSSFNVKYSNKLLLLPQYRLFRFLGRSLKIIYAIRSCDIMYIGGGGLLQDTHNLFTPHHFLHWLSYANCPICLVGIGVGPVKSSFNRWYIKKMLNRSGVYIQVRDEESKQQLLEYGVTNEINVGCDIVEGSTVTCIKKVNNDIITLGCSIRPWPDIDFQSVVDMINKLCAFNYVDRVGLFVFEYDQSDHSELDFLELVKDNIKCPNSAVYVYGRDNNFYEELSKVDFAIASRYHANVLWQKMKIPVVPIPYAPKVYSLYSKHNISIKPFSEVVERPSYERIEIDEHYHLPQNAAPSNFSLSLLLLNYLIGFMSFMHSMWKSICARLF